MILASTQTKRPKHRRRLDRDAGIDQDGRKTRQAEFRAEFVTDAAHHARPGIEADRHVSAGKHAPPRESAGSVEREAVETREQPQRRRSIRRPAADARRDRQALDEVKGAELQPLHPFGEEPRGLEHEIVVVVAGERRSRPVDSKRQRRAGRQSKRVADACESNEAFEGMVAVRAPPQDVEREVDLCRGAGGQGRGHA